jgi:hypothetical protein
MPTFQVFSDPSLIAIRARSCPKCLGPMVLASIKPSLVGWELHTFVGVNCDHVDKVVTEINPPRNVDRAEPSAARP